MKKKIALAFAGLLLIMTISFAPISSGTWHGLPDVQSDTYIVVGGSASTSKVVLHMGPLPIGPSTSPYVTRPPWATPETMWQDVNFSMAFDPTGGVLGPCVVFLTVPWQSIQSLEHVYFSASLGYTRVKLLPVPGKDGVGWLYTLPGIADVDIISANTYINNPLPGPYNITNPPTIPISLWAGPFMTGNISTPNPPGTGSGAFDPFPDPGADTLPGFCPMGAGTQDDGFGDGTPDPAGSSVIFLPLQLSVESWNGTAFVFKFGGPFVLPLTTGIASDTVVPGPVAGLLDGESMTYVGAPWEDVATTNTWGADANKKTVSYAYAWSFIQYYLSDGPPAVKLDLLYGGKQNWVMQEHVVHGDINGDGTCDIFDSVLSSAAFGSRDEGSVAPPGYDPYAYGHDKCNNESMWSGPYPPYMPAPWCVCSIPDPVAGGAFDARADLVPDGLIDIFDYVRLSVTFGQSV